MRACVAVIGFLATTGCFSVMPHPTRVDNAFRLGATLSVSAVSDSSSNIEDASTDVEMGALPLLDLEASIGIRDTSIGNPGFGLRLAGVAGIGGFGGSAYVEMPRAWAGTVDVGLGAQLHRGALDVIMPYFQVGAMRGTEASWFMRNGVSWATARDSTDRKLLWLPTVGWYRHRSSGVDLGMYLTAVVGNQPLAKRPCILFECFSGEGGYMRTYLIIGMTANFVLERPTARR